MLTELQEEECQRVCNGLGEIDGYVNCQDTLELASYAEDFTKKEGGGVGRIIARGFYCSYYCGNWMDLLRDKE